MPYISDHVNFERVDGEVIIEGRPYKYVERKIECGQLVLMCLRDDHRAKIDHAKNEFNSHENGGSGSHKKTTSPKKIIIITECEEASRLLLKRSVGTASKSHITFVIPSLRTVVLGFADKPPENSYRAMSLS